MCNGTVCVCPSICLSVCLQHGPTTADPLLQVCCCGPGGQEISIDCCQARGCSGGRIRAVSRCQRTSEAEHGLVWKIAFSTCVFSVFTARCFAPAVLAMGLCPSVSVTSRCSIETAERIELVFGMWVSFHPFYTVLKGNSIISKNKGTSLWNFVLNSGLKEFRHGILIVETCYQLSSRKVDAQSVINWAVVGQLSRLYPRAPTLNHYSLSHRSSSAVYSTICDFVARVN